MTVTIRPLAPVEWEAFRDIRLAALAESPGNFFATLADARDGPQERWLEMLESDDGVVFGLFDDARLVGLTAVYVDRAIAARDTAGLGMTWVAPGWRGRGLSAMIYAARIAWARERGLRRIIVSHRASNEPSRRAMLAAGFREIARRPHRWPDGVEEDDVAYELALTGADAG